MTQAKVGAVERRRSRKTALCEGQSVGFRGGTNVECERKRRDWCVKKPHQFSSQICHRTAACV